MLRLPSLSKGFTLFEIVVVVAIMGVVIATIMRFRRPSFQKERTYVIKAINRLLHVARQSATIKNKIHRVTVYTDKTKPSRLHVERQLWDPAEKKKVYQLIVPADITSYQLPQDGSIQELFVDGVPQLEERKKVASFYIIPNGVFEPVTLYMRFMRGGREEKLSLILEPFLGQFRLAEGFIRPKRRKRQARIA